MENPEIILSEVVDILKRNNRDKICLIQGTLLGAYRDKRIMGWDHDIDLLLFTDMIGLTHEFEKNGYDILENWKNVFLSVKKRDCIVDLHVGSFVGDNFIIDVPIVTDKYPKELFEDFTNITLHGIDFMAPNNIEKYLMLCYGENWRIPKTQNTDKDCLFERVWKWRF